MNNIGYLTSDRTDDSLFSPFYIVDHIVKYIPKDKKIWCPFDIEEWSAFSVRSGWGRDEHTICCMSIESAF